MIEEILLRIADPGFRGLQLRIAEILRQDFRVSMIDDSVPNAELIKHGRRFEKIICLSQDIIWPADFLAGQVSFFKISRVFCEQGNHLGWFIPSISSSVLRFDSDLIAEVGGYSGPRCCVVDSDIASGSTKAIAARLFPHADFYAPIQLEPHQDLVDVEDLVLERSLVWKEDQFCSVSYLNNKTFFRRRTSVPETRYEPISELVRGAFAKTQKS